MATGLRSVWKLQVRASGQSLGPHYLPEQALGALATDSTTLYATSPAWKQHQSPGTEELQNPWKKLVQGQGSCLRDKQGTGRRTTPCTKPSRDVPEGAHISQPTEPAPLYQKRPHQLWASTAPQFPQDQDSCTSTDFNCLTHGLSLHQR